MLNKRSLPITLIVGLFSHLVFSQGGYIATDSSMMFGVQLIERTAIENAQFVSQQIGQVGLKRSYREYKPEQLSEYGFQSGKSYVSKNISISGEDKKVFLQRLERGSLTLLYYVDKDLKTFFIQRDSTLFMEVPKGDGKNFRAIISQNATDFDGISDPIKLARYSKLGMTKLITHYNNRSTKPFPFIRFGVLAGVNSTSLKIPSGFPNNFLRDISFVSHTSVSVGLYADLPIEMSYISFNAGINFSKSNFEESSSSTNLTSNVKIEMFSMDVPLLFRYTVPGNKLRPFINAGGNLAFQVKNNNSLTGTVASIRQGEEITTPFTYNLPLTSETQVGYIVGAGLQYGLNYRKAISLELRYGQNFGEKNTLDRNQLQILVGFSI